MALGYEGWVKIGNTYALGTGTAVPRARARLDSASGYGGRVSSPVAEIGVGAPRTYDWEVFDGSLNFEVTKDIFLSLKAWILARDTQKDLQFSTRKGNLQEYTQTFWNSISISASETAVLDGSLGFVATEREGYAYGVQGIAGYFTNKTGAGLLCPLASGMPPPLNPGFHNYYPVPFWNTQITLGGSVYDFLSWTLDFSQDVVKFFACNHTAGPQGPVYMGVGSMTATFSGAFMWIDTTKPLAFPADTILAVGSTPDAIVQVSDVNMQFKDLELMTVSDDVQAQDSTTPVNLEYAIYRLSAA